MTPEREQELRQVFPNNALERLTRAEYDYYSTHGEYVPALAELALLIDADRAALLAELATLREEGAAPRARDDSDVLLARDGDALDERAAGFEARALNRTLTKKDVGWLLESNEVMSAELATLRDERDEAVDELAKRELTFAIIKAGALDHLRRAEKAESEAIAAEAEVATLREALEQARPFVFGGNEDKVRALVRVIDAALASAPPSPETATEEGTA
jgi:hypothetical protein